MIRFHHAEGMKLHTSSARPIGSQQERLFWIWGGSPGVESLESVVFFLDAIIFIQDDILMSTRYHHPDDIIV